VFLALDAYDKSKLAFLTLVVYVSTESPNVALKRRTTIGMYYTNILTVAF
jgi:hypothetical protein